MAKLVAMQTECDMTEAEAVSQAEDGDAAAFEELYQAHCRRVYNLCLRMIKNPSEAEDLTPQAFLQAFRKIGTFRGDSGFSTWLHRVIVNIVLLHLRRRRPTEIVGDGLERRSSNDNGSRRHGSTDSSMLGAIERLNLMRAIRKLPRGYKQVFFCTTSLDTNARSSRDSWDVRPIVQNRSFTRPANDCAVCSKQIKRARKPVWSPHGSEVRTTNN
jgi:RNA polymerase sigma-70 factor (ECF subfamily)